MKMHDHGDRINNGVMVFAGFGNSLLDNDIYVHNAALHVPSVSRRTVIAMVLPPKDTPRLSGKVHNLPVDLRSDPTSVRFLR